MSSDTIAIVAIVVPVLLACAVAVWRLGSAQGSTAAQLKAVGEQLVTLAEHFTKRLDGHSRKLDAQVQDLDEQAKAHGNLVTRVAVLERDVERDRHTPVGGIPLHRPSAPPMRPR